MYRDKIKHFIIGVIITIVALLFFKNYYYYHIMRFNYDENCKINDTQEDLINRIKKNQGLTVDIKYVKNVTSGDLEHLANVLERYNEDDTKVLILVDTDSSEIYFYKEVVADKNMSDREIEKMKNCSKEFIEEKDYVQAISHMLNCYTTKRY